MALDKIACLRIYGLKKVSARTNVPLLNLTINKDFVIPNVEETKILGMIFDKYANYEKHINDVVMKAKQGLNILKVVKGGVLKDFVGPDALLNIHLEWPKEQLTILNLFLRGFVHQKIL